MPFFERLHNLVLRRCLSIDPVSREKVHRDRRIEWLGTEYGGSIIPVGSLSETSVCYSAGAGEDISFEAEVASRYGSSVYIFDPTPRARAHYDELRERVGRGERMPINNSPTVSYRLTPETAGRLHFEDVGLWDREGRMKFYAPRNPTHVSHSIANLQKTADYFEGRVDRVSNIMKRLGHRRLDLLKLDIAGAEYVVLDSIIADSIEVGIICVEFNEWQLPQAGYYRSRIRGAVLRLEERGYLMVSASCGHYTLVRQPASDSSAPQAA